jgi:hypothetical protein
MSVLKPQTCSKDDWEHEEKIGLLLDLRASNLRELVRTSPVTQTVRPCHQRIASTQRTYIARNYWNVTKYT